MRNIYNLTQHTATTDQQMAGVVDLDNKEYLHKVLTFDSLPTGEDVVMRAQALLQIMIDVLEEDSDALFMLGGAPYLMAKLSDSWIFPESIQNKVLFAYSERVSEEVVEPDGSVRKVNVFKHMGFVPLA